MDGRPTDRAAGLLLLSTTNTWGSHTLVAQPLQIRSGLESRHDDDDDGSGTLWLTSTWMELDLEPTVYARRRRRFYSWLCWPSSSSSHDRWWWFLFTILLVHHRATDRQSDQEQDEDAAAGYYVFYILKAFFGFIPKHSMPAGPVLGLDVGRDSPPTIASGPMKHGLFCPFLASEVQHTYINCTNNN